MRIQYEEEYCSEFNLENFEIHIHDMNKREFETVKKMLEPFRRGEE